MSSGSNEPTSAGSPVADAEGSRKSDHPVVDNASKLLQEAQEALDQIEDTAPRQPAAFQLEDLVGHEGPPEKCSIDLLRDVDLDLKIELGRTQMLLEDVLKLRRGSIVTLDKLAGDPVDLYANGRLVARGEVMVLNDNFCIRVAELVGSDLIGSS
jgi:flagellar motor switch protein FliN